MALSTLQLAPLEKDPLVASSEAAVPVTASPEPSSTESVALPTLQLAPVLKVPQAASSEAAVLQLAPLVRKLVLAFSQLHGVPQEGASIEEAGTTHAQHWLPDTA